MIISREDGKMKLSAIPFGEVFKVEKLICMKLDALSCSKIGIDGFEGILITILESGKLMVLAMDTLVIHVPAILELKC